MSDDCIELKLKYNKAIALMKDIAEIDDTNLTRRACTIIKENVKCCLRELGEMENNRKN